MSEKSFFGGVHPVEQEKLTRDIPLSQHIGKHAPKDPGAIEEVAAP